MLAEFMIPGVSAHVLLVFTLVHRRKPDDPVPRDIFLGQAVLGLQSLVALTIGERECTLDLGDIEVSNACLCTQITDLGREGWRCILLAGLSDAFGPVLIPSIRSMCRWRPPIPR